VPPLTKKASESPLNGLDSAPSGIYDSRTRMTPTTFVRRAVSARVEVCTAGLALLLLLVLLIPMGGSAI